MLHTFCNFFILISFIKFYFSTASNRYISIRIIALKTRRAKKRREITTPPRRDGAAASAYDIKDNPIPGAFYPW